jgi:hypothetical protein
MNDFSHIPWKAKYRYNAYRSCGQKGNSGAKPLPATEGRVVGAEWARVTTQEVIDAIRNQSFLRSVCTVVG